MNRKTKEVVFEVLESNVEARSNDMELIYQTLKEMLDVNAGTPLLKILTLMKEQGISFESITKWRRKWLEEHPDIKESLEITPFRQEEAEKFIRENMNHIPEIDGYLA